MKNVEVVAGLLREDGRLLVCQRREDAAFPLKWEFPGGKVEKGESHYDALRRELTEELGVTVNSCTEIYRHTHRYSEEFSVNLRFYRIDSYSGELQNLAFHRIEWSPISNLSNFDFLDGDLPLVDRLLSSQSTDLLS